MGVGLPYHAGQYFTGGLKGLVSCCGKIRQITTLRVWLDVIVLPNMKVKPGHLRPPYGLNLHIGLPFLQIRPLGSKQARDPRLIGTIVRIKLLGQSGAPTAGALSDLERPQLAPLALGPFLLHADSPVRRRRATGA